MARRQVSCTEVVELLASPDVTDQRFLEVFQLTHDGHRFRYRLRDDVEVDEPACLPEHVLAEPRLHRGVHLERLLSTAMRQHTASGRGIELLVALANGHKQQRQNQRYERSLLEHPDRPVLVAEGDSWFNYPIELRDVVDHLGDVANVYTVAEAGDTIEDMARHLEPVEAVDHHQPRALLVSAGGNDLILRMQPFLRPAAPTAPAERFLYKGKARQRVAHILRHYRVLLEHVHARRPELPIIVHSYDYLRPQLEHPRALGPRPLAVGVHRSFLAAEFDDVGIPPHRQGEVAARVVDLFHEGMVTLANRLRAQGMDLRLVDLRGLVPREHWANAIHPDSEGYRRVAERLLGAL